ncbi:ParB/RepB/Spo0J family partition protein [Novosphingobium sp. ES2-1]|jgi:ParB family transcriptional regulator, chromosome partitioning protein|uniref:ParB/RepB/Spo0J family partition protein n=1 Tax=Novosphingobium sp. ES2-1 TaxID=2780074 RepID=UPI00188000AF|nr:ParB/RepB/Spo0J family partition protein [Novosphingobium sp. ES2-1]QOV96324.1 ParB N-terminal domain-containing protein [Novosphingobium sp. ES2-1]
MNDIELIPLGKLRLSEANVRRQDSNLFIEELAANIEAKGLLQNLIVVPAKKRGLFDVTAGGRRLRALNFLLTAGKLPKDHPIACRVLDIDAAEQSELSLIENVIRLDMTPTDEIRAYKHFVGEGADLDAIAKRFGRTRRFIEGRLRLADLADPIFAALEEGKITLDVAKAYATTPNHERQMMVWNELSNSWQGNNPDSIRRMVTHSAIRSSSPMAKLASEADYLAAGGKIERDLFTEDGGETWIDADIAQRIAGEKLQAFAAEIAQASGYAWVRPILETRVTYNATENLHQVDLEPAPLTEEEQVEADKLLETISALEAESETLDEDDEAAAAEFQERWDAASSAYDALHDKPPVIPEEMKANVGCFVIIGADGRPAVASGLYSDKPLERRKARGSDASEGASGAGEGGSAATAPKLLSQKLVEELAVQRRDILAINLASNPAIALDYLIFAIADSRALYSAQALGTTLRAPSPSLTLANYPESPAHTLMADMRETLDLSWTEHCRTVDRFSAFSALDDDAKASWLALCMAKTLEASMGIDKKAGQPGPEPIDLHDHLAALMGIKVASHWRPTSANYFDRVAKQTLLGHVREVGGPAMAASFMGSKKSDLSASCEKLFAGETIVAPEIREAALAWVPEAMRFRVLAASAPCEEAPVEHEPAQEEDVATSETVDA